MATQKKHMPTCRLVTKSSEGTKMELAGPSTDKRNAAAFDALMGDKAMVDVHAERVRQKNEGRDAKSDDLNDSQELRMASIAVLTGDRTRWPFPSQMKEREYREGLVVAAALLWAEINRVDRQSAKVAEKKGG